jgi:hypothetical protein
MEDDRDLSANHRVGVFEVGFHDERSKAQNEHV